MKTEIIKAVQFLDRTKNILFSLLIGGMTGAAIMLFFAPQSGRQTRSQIFKKFMDAPKEPDG